MTPTSRRLEQGLKRDLTATLVGVRAAVRVGQEAA